jgi:hypothetical protein
LASIRINNRDGIKSRLDTGHLVLEIYRTIAVTAPHQRNFPFGDCDVAFLKVDYDVNGVGAAIELGGRVIEYKPPVVLQREFEALLIQI